MKIKIRFYLYFILAVTIPIIAIFSWHKYPYLSILCLLAFIILYIAVRKDFLAPIDNISKWLISYQKQNNDIIKTKSFKQIASAIDHLIDENQYLYDDMEMVLNKQVQRLSKKTASLEILYGVTEKINKINDKKQLFKQFLTIFIDMSGASGGIIRERVNGKLRLVAQQNASLADLEVSEKTPCALADGVQFSVYDCNSCTKADKYIGTVFIPLNHKGENFGAFALFFNKEPSLAYDERLLMQTIADNISVYLDKLQQMEKARIVEIAKEKLYLSQELHDSLAQTIYSINLQISALSNLVKGESYAVKDKISLLKNNAKQANSELRVLIDNFRYSKIPNNEDIVQKLINDFKNETNIKVYTQIDDITLNIDKKQQITRIIGEALINIKKHSKAKNVRIVYTNFQLLIEDDGVGFDQNIKDHDGHIGVQVMRERAQRIDAKFYIDSEQGEGTLIIVNYEL